MTTVMINAITVPPGVEDELAKRFEAQSALLSGQQGFVDFQLLRPTDERNRWLVVSRWDSAASYDAWKNSAVFDQMHRGQLSGHGHPGSSPTHGDGPLAIESEVWSFEVSTTTA